jgi:hypothetical protein
LWQREIEKFYGRYKMFDLARKLIHEMRIETRGKRNPKMVLPMRAMNRHLIDRSELGNIKVVRYLRAVSVSSPELVAFFWRRNRKILQSYSESKLLSGQFRGASALVLIHHAG